MTSPFLRAAAVAVLALVGASACATTRAETPRERPALDVPVPPPRVITPLPAPDPPPPEPVGELPGNAAPTPTRPRPSRPAETAKPETQKPEEKPVEPPPAATTVAPPVPQLRIPETGDNNQSSAGIRDIIDRTRKVLRTIDYGPLSNQRKKAYDDARLFADQAEEALKGNNLVFAKELADKAERLAKELQGR